jgi:hypothetical protein
MRRKNSKRLKEMGGPSDDLVAEAVYYARRYGLTKDEALKLIQEASPATRVALGGKPFVKPSKKPQSA